MKKTVCVILTIAIVLGMTACANTAKDWQEQYDLGMRYLDDGDYEEAILAFTAAIEIDGDRPEAYMGRAQAYIAIGEPEKALKDYKKAKRAAQNSEEDYEDLIEDLEERIGELEEEISQGENNPGSESGMVTDASPDQYGDGYPEDPNCHIPQINLENGQAPSINRDLYELLTDGYYVEQKYDSISYIWGMKDGMLSLVVMSHLRGEGEDNYEVSVLTLYVETGELVPTGELLAAYGQNLTSYHVLEQNALIREGILIAENIQDCIYYDPAEGDFGWCDTVFNSADGLPTSDLSSIPFVGETGSLCMYAICDGSVNGREGIFELITGDEDTPQEDGDETVSVTDAYSCQFTNSYGGVFCCHIPRINLENDVADSLNQQIYEEYYNYAQNQQYGFHYMWNVYGDILSVVIVRSYTEYDWVEYRIYTISTVTGEAISQEELLAAYAMDEDAFYSRVTASLERSASQWTPDQIGEYTYQYIQEHSLSEENIHFAVPFVGPDGILCMLCRYYTPAGAGMAYGLHQVSTDDVVGIPSCNGNHGVSGTRTVAEITALAAQWYNDNVVSEWEGYFVADESNSFLIHDKCSVSVYFYYTDTDNPGTEALPFAVVQVDVNTGEMWDVMAGNSLGYLW